MGSKANLKLHVSIVLDNNFIGGTMTVALTFLALHCNLLGRIKIKLYRDGVHILSEPKLLNVEKKKISKILSLRDVCVD